MFPTLIAPPNVVGSDSLFAPTPSPIQSGGPGATPPNTVVPSTGTVLGYPPANAPTGSFSGSSSSASSLVNNFTRIPLALVLALFLEAVTSYSL